MSEYRWQNPDDEALPVTQCACGATYKPWELILSVYSDDPKVMPCCNRKLYFRQRIEIVEVA